MPCTNYALRHRWHRRLASARWERSTRPRCLAQAMQCVTNGVSALGAIRGPRTRCPGRRRPRPRAGPVSVEKVRRWADPARSSAEMGRSTDQSAAHPRTLRRTLALPHAGSTRMPRQDNAPDDAMHWEPERGHHTGQLRGTRRPRRRIAWGIWERPPSGRPATNPPMRRATQCIGSWEGGHGREAAIGATGEPGHRHHGRKGATAETAPRPERRHGRDSATPGTAPRPRQGMCALRRPICLRDGSARRLRRSIWSS